MVLKEKPNLIVILGPTASGKSELAVEIAEEFNGEVVSADSRQVYKGMNIGTGKITKEEMRGVRHELLDVTSPKRRFTVAQYQKRAKQAIEKIIDKGKIPILCGGTGFYIQSIVDDIVIPKVKPDWKLREKLEKQTAHKLFQKLKKLDPQRAKIIDRNNKRRLIRAIEIVLKTKKPVPKLKIRQKYNALLIGIQIDQQELKKRIKARLLKRLKQGMVEEAKRLVKSGVSYKRLEEFGLEYRYLAYYLQNKISYSEMVEKLQKEIEQYSKRQMTWFKKDRRIIWIHPPKFCGAKPESVKKTAFGLMKRNVGIR